jgi:MFS family permease
MAVLGAVCLALLAWQTTAVGLLALWFGFSVFQNGQYATLSAAIPDHVPVRQRATVAGWVGMPYALGLVIGVELVARVFTTFAGGYLMLAVCLVHWGDWEGAKMSTNDTLPLHILLKDVQDLRI